MTRRPYLIYNPIMKTRPMTRTMHKHLRKISTKPRSNLNIQARTHGNSNFKYVHSHYEKSCILISKTNPMKGFGSNLGQTHLTKQFALTHRISCS